jgi:hypothetical protein
VATLPPNGCNKAITLRSACLRILRICIAKVVLRTGPFDCAGTV